MPYQLPPYTQLIAHAHRGNSGPAPGNTRPALEQAIAAGVDMAEVDVRLSRDGIPVLIHHPTLEHTTNGKGRVDEHSIRELRQLDAGGWRGPQFAGEPPLSLYEGLELARNRVALNLDLKTEQAIPAIIRAVRDMRMIDQVVISGCARTCIKTIQASETRLTVLLNLGQPLKLLARNGPAALFRAGYLTQARVLAPAGINVDHRYVNRQLIEATHRHGLSVWTWTVDDEARLKELVDLGVDSISTNWPERMLRVINRNHTQHVQEENDDN